MNQSHIVSSILIQAQSSIESVLGHPVEITLSLPSDQLEAVQIQKDITLRRIICKVCDVPWHKVESVSRKRENVIARQLYCYHAKSFLGYPLKSIGQTVGG